MATSNRAITGLDHVLVGVRDLDAARSGFARLGFNSSPKGKHIGWGTANYCIMLDDDYIELLGIVDAEKFTNGLDRFLEKRQGMMGLALGSGDPHITRDVWREAGLASAEFRPLRRLLESPDGDIDVAFENVMLDRADCAGVPLFACHHLTPELLRRPGWTSHPNGARRLRSVTVLVPGVEQVADTFTRLLGRSALTRTDDVVTAHAGTTTILLTSPGDAALLHPAFDWPDEVDEPILAVLEIETGNSAKARRFLDVQGVPYGVETDGGLTVQPDEAFGVALEFTPGETLR
ncbi:MAG: VOC family protein [Geminicoccaceae bacterium]|nr:VOC family protein [Geminicoccaceae bacterium]